MLFYFTPFHFIGTKNSLTQILYFILLVNLKLLLEDVCIVISRQAWQMLYLAESNQFKSLSNVVMLNSFFP
jgi:hypothetical protein